MLCVERQAVQIQKGTFSWQLGHEHSHLQEIDTNGTDTDRSLKLTDLNVSIPQVGKSFLNLLLFNASSVYISL